MHDASLAIKAHHKFDVELAIKDNCGKTVSRAKWSQKVKNIIWGAITSNNSGVIDMPNWSKYFGGFVFDEEQVFTYSGRSGIHGLPANSPMRASMAPTPFFLVVSR
jgi:hypothetical protein